MHPREYLSIRKRAERNIRRLERIQLDAIGSALGYPTPNNLRPAVAGDIVVDQVLWYPGDEEHWTIVEEVLRPNDAFKAYMWGGGRYGLDGAFVEDE